MRISAKAQYACVAMVELACRHGMRTPVQLKTIADNHGVSARFLVLILLELKTNGLIESTRGTTGGYLLARPPDQITLLDVINAVEPPQPAAPAIAGLHSTPAVQAINRCFEEAQARAQARFAEITLADLVKQTQPVHELSFQI
jgi:Rrf2 family protein